MSKDVTSGLQTEFDALRAHALALAGYFASLGVPSYRAALERRASDRPTRTVVEGWREARNDLLEATRALSGAQLRELNARLLSECGITLDSIQERRMKRLVDLRARGRLSTDEQYRLVESRIDQLGDDPGAQEELRELLALINQYDALVHRRLEQQRKRRDRAG